MNYSSLLSLLFLVAPGCCKTGREVPVHQVGRFRSRVYDDSGDPVIVFGNIDDGGKLYCFELDGLFEARQYNINMKKNPTFTPDNYLDLEDDAVKWQYMHNADGSTFTIFSTDLKGRANRIELSFDYRKMDGNDGLKFSIKINGYRWKNVGAYLVLFGDLERCNALKDFDVKDSTRRRLKRKKRRRRRRRLVSSRNDNSRSLASGVNDNSKSVDGNDNGISSDDSEEYDLGSAVFQNTPSFRCGSNTYNASLHYVDDGDANEDNYEGLHLVYPYFGNCDLVQDPGLFVDERKVNGNLKIGVVGVFISVIITMLLQA